MREGRRSSYCYCFRPSPLGTVHRHNPTAAMPPVQAHYKWAHLGGESRDSNRAGAIGDLRMFRNLIVCFFFVFSFQIVLAQDGQQCPAFNPDDGLSQMERAAINSFLEKFSETRAKALWMRGILDQIRVIPAGSPCRYDLCLESCFNGWNFCDMKCSLFYFRGIYDECVWALCQSCCAYTRDICVDSCSANPCDPLDTFDCQN